MSDIFVSYAREDRYHAERIANALESWGWSVWWDSDILPGETFHESISQKLQKAKVVVVIWTENSVKSNWVRDEANVGLERGVLIPVSFGDVELPIGFRSIQAVPLDNWGRVSADPAFDSFLRAVKRNLERQPSAPVPVQTPPVPQPTPQTQPIPSKPSQSDKKPVMWIGISVLLFLLVIGMGAVIGKEWLWPDPTITPNTGTGGLDPATDTPTPKPNTPPTFTPTPTKVTLDNPTDTPILGSAIIPYWEDPVLWFPTEDEVLSSPQLIPQTIKLITNEEASYGSSERMALFESWGRVHSYERFYSHPQLCSSSDLKGLYIQIIFFEDKAGAIDFYNWAHEGANVVFKDYVGENAYIYTDDYDTRETDCPVSYYSISFQRDNAFARVRVRSLPGTMSNDDMRKIGKPIAILIDEKFQEYIR
jgi:hypothetical protein